MLYVEIKDNEKKSRGVLYEKLYDNAINSNEMSYFSHFETNQTLKNYKNASNYEALNQQLSSLLYPQYRFLLKESNFDYNSIIRNTRNYNQTQMDQLLKNITMKLF